jgi:ABC-type glycerol-3-phosphate transport system permease component
MGPATPLSFTWGETEYRVAWMPFGGYVKMASKEEQEVMKRHTIKLSFSDRIFHLVNYIYLTIVFFVVLFPLINIVSQSLSSPGAVIAGKVFLWPVNFTLAAYKRIITNPDLIRGFLNSLFYTGFGTLLNVLLSIMAAYPLSRKDFYGWKIFIGLFVFTMLFRGGLIPSYMVVRALKLYNTRWAMILPSALSVWNVMLARTFFQNTIPTELYDAAEIDGASDFQVLVRVVLPLAAPIIAVLTLFYAVGHWNSFFHGLIYLRSKALLPLQVVLRNILANAEEIEAMVDVTLTANDAQVLALVEVLKYAIIVFASLPVLILYPFIQKYFVKGIMVGSLKG